MGCPLGTQHYLVKIVFFSIKTFDFILSYLLYSESQQNFEHDDTDAEHVHLVPISVILDVSKYFWWAVRQSNPRLMVPHPLTVQTQVGLGKVGQSGMEISPHKSIRWFYVEMSTANTP